MKKGAILFLVLVILISNFYIISAENSEGNSSDWRMYGRWLNHTKWLGDFTQIQGLNNVTYNFSGDPTATSLINGSIYFTNGPTIYQLNASNVSQLINTGTLSGSILIDDIYPVSVGNYIYVVTRNDDTGLIDQLNASNISQIIATTTPINAPVGASPVIYGNHIIYQNSFLYKFNLSNVSQIVSTSNILLGGNSVPAIANGFIYVSSSTHVYQLNLSNISQQIANRSAIWGGVSSPAVYEGSVYIGMNNTLLQLNASNISQSIANYTIGGASPVSSPAIVNGFVYMGGGTTNRVYQLNASNISQSIANYTTSGAVYSSPVAGYGSIYIGSNDNKMYQLNASNISKVIGIYTTGGDIDTAPTLAGNYLYFESEDGKLYQILARNISDQTPPTISINYPESREYDSLDIPVEFNASEDVTCSYSLSTEESASGLADGEISNIADSIQYTLEATCEDLAGNIDQESVSFNVSLSTDSSSSSSGSSSSSSSSGGNRIINSYIFVKANDNPHETLLGANDRYEIKISEETHTITLNSFNESVAEVIIRSEPKKISLQLNSPKEVDIDSDGNNDLILVYSGKEKGKAKISISDIHYLATEEKDIESPIRKDKENSFRFIFEIMLVIISAVVVSVYYRIKYPKHLRHLH